MFIKNKKGFTLTELIMAIIILAILGTISFISILGYSADARDSARIADINNIKTAVELVSLDLGKLPLPDNAQAVTYSGSIIWQQGTIGDSVRNQITETLSNKPLDPLYGTEYIYSTTYNRKKYEIMSLYEGDLQVNINNTVLLSSANANTDIAVKVEGNYNGLFIRKPEYIIGTPSIITALPLPLAFNAETIKSQVINGGENIPDMGIVKILLSTGALANLKLGVYNGSIGKKSTALEKRAVVIAIQGAYTGSSLASKGKYKNLLEQTSDNDLLSYSDNVILGVVSAPQYAVVNSCDNTTKPTNNGNITYAINPISPNQSYIQNSIECGYTCTNGYSGNNCTTAPSNLVSNWTFNTDYVDYGTSGNNSTGYNSASTLDSTDATPERGSYVTFSGGVGSYINIPDNPDYGLSEGAIGLWVKTNSASTDQGIFSKDASGTSVPGHITLGINSSNRFSLRLQEVGSSYALDSPSNSVGLNWNHLFVTFGSRGIELYLNGVLVSTDLFTGGIAGNLNPISLGAKAVTSTENTNSPLTNPLDGSIDEVSIYNEQITSTEILDIYNSQKSDSCDLNTRPIDNGNISYTENPTITNQAYIQGNTTTCGYTCTNGYGGVNCSTPAGLITQVTCEGAGWFWVDPATDVYVGASRGDGFCISPRYGDWSDSGNGAGGISWNGWGHYTGQTLNGWNTGPVDDTGNSNSQWGQTRNLDSEVSYDCKSLGTASSDFDASDTIEGRMKWLATTGNAYAEARSIDWITGLVPHNPPQTIVQANQSAIPSLYIADCIDGEKDLLTNMDYKHYPNEGLNETITYSQYNTDVLASNNGGGDIALSDSTFQNRQKYLIAWTQKSGSHLPSAMSYISSGFPNAADGDGGSSVVGNDRGEYQVACEAGLLIDADDDIDNEAIWLAAIGSTVGGSWGTNIRYIGNQGCSAQWHRGPSYRNGTNSARFIVRP